MNADKVIKELMENFKLIDSSDIPNISLYMDQITTFMDEQLKHTKRFEEDKILTKTMINNYAKNELLPPPEKKKYSKEHIIMLTFIYYFKNVMSINDIKTILDTVSDKYFYSKGDMSLEEIYEEISDMQLEEVSHIVDDLKHKFEFCASSFDTALPGDKKFLQLFSLISLLNFDIYAKKQLIESIVDEMNKHKKPNKKG